MLTPSNVQVKSASKTNNVVTIQIDGFTAHTYRLQRTGSLSPVNFVDVGAAQAGAGTTAPVVLTFTDPNASAAESFYRVQID